MAEITRILAANIRRQFFFVITTAAFTRCLVKNFQLICYSQRVNATSQYNDSGSSTCSKWPNDRMVAVVKHCWLLVQGRRCCRERWLMTTTGQVFKKILACSVSRRVIVIAWFSCLCLKDQLGLCLSNCHTHTITGNCSASQRVLVNSLRVVSAKRGNPPLDIVNFPQATVTRCNFSCSLSGNIEKNPL